MPRSNAWSLHQSLNVFRDTARATEVGKLKKRIRGILSKLPEFVDATVPYAGTPAWTLPPNGEALFTGDWAELLTAPKLRSVEPLENLNVSGPTSAANKRRFAEATSILLDFAGGALTDVEISKCLVRLFELDDLDAFLLRDDDQAKNVRTTAEAPGQRIQAVEAADEIWVQLSHDERLALPHLSESAHDFAASCPSVSNPEKVCLELKLKMADFADLYAGLVDAIGIVIARCEDYSIAVAS